MIIAARLAFINVYGRTETAGVASSGGVCFGVACVWNFSVTHTPIFTVFLFHRSILQKLNLTTAQPIHHPKHAPRNIDSKFIGNNRRGGWHQNKIGTPSGRACVQDKQGCRRCRKGSGAGRCRGGSFALPNKKLQ